MFVASLVFVAVTAAAVALACDVQQPRLAMLALACRAGQGAPGAGVTP
jgi:hypothetical protein